ncbi:M48 family metallopeptidase [Flavobacterium sp. LC2016-12]|uniref:tetratricopeptide repeat protein n=1 Tax=Flavobacterium sp. LC2016-12 TaxID=2783794 RepID=UPI00188BD33B|nr:tetratricopeptide repeat protein [Flavobacterium sp. LC2016-12]MBF4465236.1 tetratricopeptide repeat protein [Flavobacterium sp. LC2016-12]
MNFNKTLILFVVFSLSQNSFSQTLVSNRDKIEIAKTELKNNIITFSNCIVKSDINKCIEELAKNADNEYKKYITGGILYEIDPNESLKLHREAYLANTLEQNFILEYAIELHRNAQYQEALKLYELYSEKVPNDIRVYVWLSDCYINNNEIKKSLQNWEKANHSQNHISIDNAIFTIYGKTTQIKTRSNLKSEIEKGKISNFYPLLFLDSNWESDWWNTTTQEYFLNEDFKLAQNALGEKNNDYKILKSYLEIKKAQENGQIDQIKKIMIDNKIILENNPIPVFGEMSSDLLRICFADNLLTESEFYTKRGAELLALAKSTKDKDLLNIYAYLQATVDGKVMPETDKLGWKEFKDEKFAKSYFIGRVDTIKYNDTELNEAMLDFPNSSYLFWVKAKCAKMENKPVKNDLIEVIKREFKTFGTDQNKSSYRLKSYMGTLASEI